MDDRSIMENLLLTTKGVCDLYLHGTIESPSPNVHQVFDRALGESICMQDISIRRCLPGAGIRRKRQSSRRFRS